MTQNFLQVRFDSESTESLDGPAIRAHRFAGKPQFLLRLRDLRESPQTCDSQFFCAPKRDSQNREPGHLRRKVVLRKLNVGNWKPDATMKQSQRLLGFLGGVDRNFT